MKSKALLLLLFVPVYCVAQKQIITERIEVTNRLDAQPDREAMTIMERYKPAVDSVMAPVLGESLVGMSAGRPESLLSNWAADVMVEYSDFLDGNIILISPFDNRLAIVQLKGSDLTALMQDIAAVHGEGVSHEVRMTITSDGKLLDATISGQPIDPERTYRIATLDYLAEGNDKLYSLKKAIRVDVSDLFTRDCMMKYVREHSPITSKIEGRIMVK